MTKHRAVLLTIITSILLLAISSPYPISAENEIIISRGESFIISIELLQNGSYGDPVPNQPVEFFDQTYDTYIGSTFTDTNGEASFEHAFLYGHPLGFTLINVTYRGNSSLALAPSCQWTQVLVVSTSTIEIQVSDISLSPGDYLTFYVHLKDDSDLPIQDAALDVYCNEILLTTARTNSSGYVEYNINCNNTWYQLGQNSIYIIFDGDMNSYQRATSETFLIEVNQIPTSIQAVEISQNSIEINKTVKISAVGFFDTEFMIFTTLGLYVDDTKLMDIETNGTGYVEINLHLDENFALGTNYLQIVYSGTERYSPTSHEVELFITSPAILNIFVEELIVIHEDTEIFVELHDELNRSIPNVTITLVDTHSGQHGTLVSVSNNSRYKFSILVEGDRGERSILIDLSRNPFLSNYSYHFVFIAWSKPSLVVEKSNILGYASPLQSVTFDMHLSDYDGNLIDCLIEVYSSTHENISNYTTNSKGTTIVSITASEDEGFQYLNIYYNGSYLQYILPNEIQICFSVSKVLPVRITLIDYSVVDTLKSIFISLSIIALNGTSLDGISLDYFWLDSQGYSLSEMGIINFQLQLPLSAGIYTLSYKVKESKGTLPCEGEILIIINTLDANVGEGIGILGITAVLISSLSIPIITIIRRRYIIG